MKEKNRWDRFSDDELYELEYAIGKVVNSGFEAGSDVCVSLYSSLISIRLERRHDKNSE